MRSKEQQGAEFQESKLGPKVNKILMNEVGEEMCQAEVAHHANRLPQYLVSRPEKWVHLYKQALGITVRQRKDRKKGDQDEDQEPGASVRLSDLALYERRAELWFAEKRYIWSLASKGLPGRAGGRSEPLGFLSIR